MVSVCLLSPLEFQWWRKFTVTAGCRVHRSITLAPQSSVLTLHLGEWRGGGADVFLFGLTFFFLCWLSLLFCFKYSSNIPSILALVFVSLLILAYSLPNIKFCLCFFVKSLLIFFINSSESCPGTSTSVSTFSSMEGDISVSLVSSMDARVPTTHPLKLDS